MGDRETVGPASLPGLSLGFPSFRSCSEPNVNWAVVKNSWPAFPPGNCLCPAPTTKWDARFDFSPPPPPAVKALHPSATLLFPRQTSFFLPLKSLSTLLNTYIHFGWAGVPGHRSWNNALPLGAWGCRGCGGCGGWPFGLDANSTLDEDDWGHWERKQRRVRAERVRRSTSRPSTTGPAGDVSGSELRLPHLRAAGRGAAEGQQCWEAQLWGAPELWLAPQVWAAVEASEWLELSL